MVVSDLQLGVLSFGEIKHKLLKDLSGPSPLVNLFFKTKTEKITVVQYQNEKRRLGRRPKTYSCSATFKQIYLPNPLCTVLCLSLSVLWYSGTLVLWALGSGLWCSGTLVLWYFGTLVLWYFGTLVLWHSGTLALWHFGTLALWYFGTLVLIQKQIVAQQHSNKSIFQILSVLWCLGPPLVGTPPWSS